MFMESKERSTAKDLALKLLNSVCANDIGGCKIKACSFNGKCERGIRECGEWPMDTRKVRGLSESYLKNIRKASGKKSPHNLGQNIHEIASSILGVNIYNHPLVKGHFKTEMKIKTATTLNAIINILDKRHIREYGYSKIWNYSSVGIKEERIRRKFCKK